MPRQWQGVTPGMDLYHIKLTEVGVLYYRPLPTITKNLREAKRREVYVMANIIPANNRSKAMCFTWNNPPVQEGSVLQPFYDEATMNYLVYQYERAPSGTLHWQGYVEFINRKTYNAARALLKAPGAAMFARRGTPQEAATYCKKPEGRVENATPYEFGEISPNNQGQRTDILALRDASKSGTKRKIIEDDELCPTYAKYMKFSDRVSSLYRPERHSPCKVYLLIGPPGCGKTRSVMEQFKGDKKDDLFKVPLNGKTMWFDGYDKQDDVLIDDFAGKASFITLADCLRLLDPWGVEQVQIKGAFTWWSPKRIFITTNIYPRKWYNWEHREIQYQALARRFHAVFDFYEYEVNGDPPVGGNDLLPYIHEDYITHGISLQGCSAPPRYEGKTWWIREKPEEAIPW